MSLPIQYALTYPERVPSRRVQTDLVQIGTLTFEEPDPDRFPALRLARQAGATGGTLPAVLNAANEVAVDAFCEGRIRFSDIPIVVEQVMARHQVIPAPSLEEILQADRWARTQAQAEVNRIAS